MQLNVHMRHHAWSYAKAPDALQRWRISHVCICIFGRAVFEYQRIIGAISTRTAVLSPEEAIQDPVCQGLKRDAEQWFGVIADSDTRNQHLKLLMDAALQLERHAWYEMTIYLLEAVVKEVLRLLLSLLELPWNHPSKFCMWGSLRARATLSMCLARLAAAWAASASWAKNW